MFDYDKGVDQEKLIVFGAVVFILFFVFREIACWYWKINDIIYRLNSIENRLDNQLEIINNKLSYICENGINVRVVSQVPYNTVDDLGASNTTTLKDKSIINELQDEPVKTSTEGAIIEKQRKRMALKTFFTKKYYISDLLKKKT